MAQLNIYYKGCLATRCLSVNLPGVDFTQFTLGCIPMKAHCD